MMALVSANTPVAAAARKHTILTAGGGDDWCAWCATCPWHADGAYDEVMRRADQHRG